MAIYLTGDTHGTYDMERFEPAAWAERDWRPTADDYLIVLGDVGCIYHTQAYDPPDLDPRDQQVVDALTALPWTVLFIDGNHENHDTLLAMDGERWHGGLVNHVSNRLIHLMRGQVFEIEGLRIFTMGGAHSPDWLHRTPGLSWWPEEMPSEEDYAEARNNLLEVGNRIDLVLTHTCPTEVVAELVGDDFADPDELTNWLQRLSDKIEFNHWYFGHFHEDVGPLYDGRFTCLFESIVEIDPDGGEAVELN